MRTFAVRRLVIAAAAIAVCSTSVYAASVLPPGDDEDLVPTGKGWGQRPPPGHAPKAKPTTGSNGISYHGGPLVLGTPNVYYIWYGNWSNNFATTLLPALAQSIGGSPYFNINTTYYDGSNTHVTGTVAWNGATDDNYSRGTALSDSDVQSIVASAIGSGKLPQDTKGVYFVLTSADVNETSGFCTQYCGWHTHGTISGSDIKYAFVGNPDRCPSACEVQTTGPNGTGGGDGMANIIGHEFEEAVTDPDLNAWYDRRGYENADKCAWTFGTTSTASNGAKYNMTLGSYDYLIQQNWVNASGGYCAKSYP
jgi:Phosphate-induced protein 1 conserved region